MPHPWIIFCVAAGGAVGALARFGLSRVLHQQWPTTFPIGTFAVNLVGCLAIGFCIIWLQQRASPAVRDGVMIGFIGALTTFSTYCMESISLIQKEQYLFAALNLGGSVVGGLVAAMLGIVLARAVFGP